MIETKEDYILYDRDNKTFKASSKHSDIKAIADRMEEVLDPADKERLHYELEQKMIESMIRERQLRN